MRWDFILFFASLVMIYIGDWALYIGVSGLVLSLVHGTLKSIGDRKVRQMVVAIGLVISGIAFVGLAAFALKPVLFGLVVQNPALPAPRGVTAQQPILRLGYVTHDLQIKWPRSALFPKTDNHKSPFAVVLKNIGTQKAVDIELSFSVSIDLKKLRSDLKLSRAIPAITEKDNGDIYIPLEWVLGKPTATTVVGFGGENIRRLDVLPSDNGQNSATIVYPPAIQNILSIVLLTQAYAVGPTLNAEIMEKDQEKIFDELRKRLQRSIIFSPDIHLSIKYHDTDGNEYQEVETIRSVYQITAPPNWIFEDERREKKFFDGGFGLLSFEDRENPDEGIYNSTMRQVGQPPTQSSPPVSQNSGATINYSKAEIDKRVVALDQFYAVMTGPAWDAYLLGHKLRNEWDGMILTSSPGEFANQLQNFADKVAVALNQMADLKRKYGYYEDIIGPIINLAMSSPAYGFGTREFMDAVRALPAKPARETVRLVLPQQQRFNAGVDQYGKWIDDMKSLITRMRKEELSRPTKD